MGMPWREDEDAAIFHALCVQQEHRGTGGDDDDDDGDGDGDEYDGGALEAGERALRWSKLVEHPALARRLFAHTADFCLSLWGTRHLAGMTPRQHVALVRFHAAAEAHRAGMTGAQAEALATRACAFGAPGGAAAGAGAADTGVEVPRRRPHPLACLPLSLVGTPWHADLHAALEELLYARAVLLVQAAQAAEADGPGAGGMDVDCGSGGGT